MAPGSTGVRTSRTPSPAGDVGRVLGYGYRYGEVPLAALNIDCAAEYISRPTPVDLTKRPPVSASLGCHVVGAALPHPDDLDPRTVIAGVIKRIAVKTPTPEPALLQELGVFVDQYLDTHALPLAPDVDLGLEAWLAETTYPEWRKDELRVEWERHSEAFLAGDETYFGVAGHEKDESYVEFKHARGIHARHDMFKCAVGPVFKLIEREVFKDPAFIKHVPIAERPRYITERLSRAGFVLSASDYTSFEALFSELIMPEVEMKLFKYYVSKLPESNRYRRYFEKVLGGMNDIQYRRFWLQIRARRMSGEMCTSLGNGFSNLMFMLFVCKLKGCTDVVGVVEGDDGLFVMSGTPPTQADFARLGLIIKLETHYQLETASFCGLVFDPEDLVNVSDPREVLASFGWASRRYARSKTNILRALLRCKALSLIHQYPGCPIIQALGEYGLRVTKDVRACKLLRVLNSRKALTMWERDQLVAAFEANEGRRLPIRPVPENTRHLVATLYNIPYDHQIAIEHWLKSLDSVTPLDHPLIYHHMSPVWQNYWDRYVRTWDMRGDPDRPSIANTQLPGFVDEVEVVLQTYELRWGIRCGGGPPERPRKLKSRCTCARCLRPVVPM